MKPFSHKAISLIGIIIFVLVGTSIFLPGQRVAAQGFRVRDSYIEVQETSYPQYISLVKKEGEQERIAGQVRIIDQYLISDIEENEFLEEFPSLTSGFKQLTMSVEVDEPLFNKENFHHPPSLWDSTKTFFGFETLPEYRITKEVNKSASVRTELDLRNIKIETYYQQSTIEPSNHQTIKQTLIVKNTSDKSIDFQIKLNHLISAKSVIWDKKEYQVTENPQSFKPYLDEVTGQKLGTSIAFYIEQNNGEPAPIIGVYDFEDVFDYSSQIWVFGKDQKTNLLLLLNFSIPAYSSITLDPSYTMIESAWVSPEAVREGDIMTVTVKAKDYFGIASVTADMGGIETINLELIEGTIYDGTWQAEWLVHDVEVRVYTTIITATNTLGRTSTVSLEWSDPLIFEDDFETNDFSKWSEGTDVGSGSVIVTTSTYTNRGSYGMGFRTGSGENWAKTTHDINDSNTTVYLRFYVFFPTGWSFDASSYAIISAFTSAAWDVILGFTVEDWGGGPRLTYSYRDSGGTSHYMDTGYTFSTNAWYIVEAKLVIDTSTGEVQIWVDDDEKVHITSVNTGTNNVRYLEAGTIWTDGTHDFIYIDDYAFNDSRIGEAGEANTAPTFTAGPSDGGSSSSTPTNVGSNVTFSATSSDTESDDWKLLVCSTSSSPTPSTSSPECAGGSGNRWCVSSSWASSTVANNCTYAATTSDAESNAWWAFSCDNNSGAQCSASSQGTADGGTESPFKVNHKPTFYGGGMLKQ